MRKLVLVDRKGEVIQSYSPHDVTISVGDILKLGNTFIVESTVHGEKEVRATLVPLFVILEEVAQKYVRDRFY